MNQTDIQLYAALNDTVGILSQIAVNQSRIVSLLERQLPGLSDGDRDALLRGTKTTLPRIQMLQRQIEDLGSSRRDVS